jgi:hypothetical protein
MVNLEIETEICTFLLKFERKKNAPKRYTDFLKEIPTHQKERKDHHFTNLL